MGSVLVAVMLMLALAGGLAERTHAEAASPDVTSATADAVVASYVEASGGRYAGDCAATVPGRDSGKVCARLVAEREGLVAYLVGRTFSEFDRWVFVSTADGARLAGATPLDLATDDGTIPWPVTA